MVNKINLTADFLISETLLADIISIYSHWQHNWSKKDFLKAFASENLGGESFWRKFESCKRNPSEFFLLLDHPHQKMFVLILFEERYKNEILQYRLNRAIFNNGVWY